MDNDEPVRYFRLTDAGNTLNPALGVLSDKGYHLYFVADGRPDYFGDYYAIQEGHAFIGEDPVRLLGLVALWEHLGDNWRTQVTHDFLTEVEDVPLADNSFQTLDDDAFRRQVAHFQLLIAVLGGDPLPATVTREQLAREVKQWIEKPPAGEESAESNP